MANNSKDGRQDAGVRERLLSGALEMFNTKGYAATSVREIVAAAGVSKPVLYYYFKNKEGIYLELMQKPFEEFNTIMGKALEWKDMDTTNAIISLCDQIFELFIKNMSAARLMYAIYYGPPQGAPHIDFEVYHLRLHESIGYFVQTGIAKGELRPVDIADATWVIIGALNIALEEQLCQHPPRLDRQGLERILRLALAGLSWNMRSETGSEGERS